MTYLVRNLIIFFIFFIAFSKEINAQPAITLSAASNIYSISCGNPTVTLIASTTGTTAVVFSAANPSLGTTINGNSVSITIGGNYGLSITSGTMTSIIPVNIIQNTSPPTASYIATPAVLSCSSPSLVLQGTSNTPSLTYSWAYPGMTAPLTTSSIVVYTNTAIAPVTTSVFSVYTLTALNPVNQCSATVSVPVYQNLFPPHASIVASQPALTCQINSITLTNNSTSGVPPGSFFGPLGINGLSWAGGEGLQNSSSYLINSPGVYTLTAQDQNNGCIATATILIGDNRVYPVVVANTVYSIACPNGMVTLPVSVVGGMSSSTYTWTSPANAVVTGQNTGTLTTNSAGVYTVTVRNNITACKTSVIMYVHACVGLKNEQNSLAQLEIFPNPANDKLNFKFENPLTDLFDLKIINVPGQTVYFTSHLSFDEPIDISELPAGIYFIKIETSSASQHNNPKIFKLIKNN